MLTTMSRQSPGSPDKAARRRQGLALGIALAALSVTWVFAGPAHASTLTTDPLHGFCTAGCADNGTNTPITSNPPTGFGFTISPKAATGDFMIDVLVPTTQVMNPSSLSFGITGIQGGISNNSNISGTASLFSSTAWSSGSLADYLGISASPSTSNRIGAYKDGGSSFYVYTADLGQNHLQTNPNYPSGPIFDMTAVPQDSYIVGFLNKGTPAKPDWVATANSGALFEKSVPPAVPEPASIALLASGLLGLGFLSRRRAA